ncbi:cytochrome c maturation protein CcmE [Brenneria corticis]|uniref:Cytochrome c-type biogenesis protein CcmE n=1 Tax=Brenneria corticis TaxID=2173106 RepID=A0A2U1U4F9_9GAMM|nr:cytochrome c maturation protein CcmE [Brenneria sp. CFCC 11842]PWC16464.1 cytochrome c maturation protein CcmE [Brenneria sp. CFCC 11842]
MNPHPNIRLYAILAIIGGITLTVTLTLYALRSNIDLFYTPGEILYGKNETREKPALGQRLRIGGMVKPGSVRRDGQSLQISFTLYDALGAVEISYQGILPDLFREGQGVVAQGVLESENHIVAQEVLARHDENYTPPEVKAAMEDQHHHAPPVGEDARL